MKEQNRKKYSAPELQVYGHVAQLTGTKCVNLWGKEKTLGYPSDTSWKIVPITDCPLS